MDARYKGLNYLVAEAEQDFEFQIQVTFQLLENLTIATALPNSLNKPKLGPPDIKSESGLAARFSKLINTTKYKVADLETKLGAEFINDKEVVAKKIYSCSKGADLAGNMYLKLWIALGNIPQDKELEDLRLYLNGLAAICDYTQKFLVYALKVHSLNPTEIDLTYAESMGPHPIRVKIREAIKRLTDKDLIQKLKEVRAMSYKDIPIEDILKQTKGEKEIKDMMYA